MISQEMSNQVFLRLSDVGCELYIAFPKVLVVCVVYSVIDTRLIHPQSQHAKILINSQGVYCDDNSGPSQADSNTKSSH